MRIELSVSRYLGWTIATVILALQIYTVLEVRECREREVWLSQEVKTITDWRKGTDPEIQRLMDRPNWTRERLQAMVDESINMSTPLREMVDRRARLEAGEVVQERVKTDSLKKKPPVSFHGGPYGGW